MTIYVEEMCLPTQALQYPHRIIVAGSRGFDDRAYFDLHLTEIVKRYPKDAVVFISGMAETGADQLIVDWAANNNYPCVGARADWADLSKGGVIKYSVNRRAYYNAAAGAWRNEDMANLATSLIVFWDGISKGTKDMINRARNKSIPITIINI